MKIEIRNDKAHISGYVNAVGRDSRPIPTSTGEYVEMMEPGVFRDALRRAEDVVVLLNHEENRKLGSTKEGSLSLREDSIGLFAEFETSDADVVKSARKNELRGWSFGMYVNKDEIEKREGNIPRRHVKDIDLVEVSIIDKRKRPCYAGTSVECRADDTDVLTETRSFDDPAEVTDHGGSKPEEGDKWEKRVAALAETGSTKKWQDRIDALNSSGK